MVKKYEEEEDEENSWLWRLVCVGLIIALFFSAIQLQNCRNAEPESIALLNAEVIGLNEDLYDESEIFFTYRLDNFGDAEARNVKVRCKLFNDNGIVVRSVLGNAGSIASSSTDVFEVTTNNLDYSLFEDGSYACYVESCDDCKILYENIPELVEAYLF